jgi:phage baseplate assembly protein V
MRSNFPLLPELIGSIKQIKSKLQSMFTIGTVSSVDYTNRLITVDNGLVTTHPIRWLTNSSGNQTEWNPPKSGDIVLLIAPGGDYTKAFALPTFYSEPTIEDEDTYMKLFSNGSLLSVNTETNTFTLQNADGSTKLKLTEGDLVAEGLDSAKIICNNSEITVTDSEIKLEADTVTVDADTIDITATDINITGAVNISGNISVGTATIFGSIDIAGGLTIGGQEIQLV